MIIMIIIIIFIHVAIIRGCGRLETINNTQAQTHRIQHFRTSYVTGVMS